MLYHPTLRDFNQLLFHFFDHADSQLILMLMYDYLNLIINGVHILAELRISLQHSEVRVEGSLNAKNQLNPFRHFRRTPAWAKKTQTYRHRAIAYTALE